MAASVPYAYFHPQGTQTPKWLASEILGWALTWVNLDLDQNTCSNNTLEYHIVINDFLLIMTYATPSPQKKIASPSSTGTTSDMFSKPGILLQDKIEHY